MSNYTYDRVMVFGFMLVAIKEINKDKLMIITDIEGVTEDIDYQEIKLIINKIKTKKHGKTNL